MTGWRARSVRKFSRKHAWLGRTGWPFYNWQILLDRGRLLEIMDKEQQREYGQYPHENKEKKEQTLRKKRIVLEAEESTWKMVQFSNNPEDLLYFIEQFPDSPYAVPAKLKLKQLKREN